MERGDGFTRTACNVKVAPVMCVCVHARLRSLLLAHTGALIHAHTHTLALTHTRTPTCHRSCFYYTLQLFRAGTNVNSISLAVCAKSSDFQSFSQFFDRVLCCHFWMNPKFKLSSNFPRHFVTQKRRGFC